LRERGKEKKLRRERERKSAEHEITDYVVETAYIEAKRGTGEGESTKSFSSQRSTM
jgi:hypothetical protein